MCDAIYIDNTQKKLNKRMDDHISNFQRLLKDGQNKTHLLTIMDNSLNIICHTRTYISVLDIKSP